MPNACIAHVINHYANVRLITDSKISNFRRDGRRKNSSAVWRFTTAAFFIVTATVGISAFGEDKPAPTDSGSDLLCKKLELRIDEIAMRFDGVMGIAIVDLTDGRPALVRNAEHVFPAASSIKLPILEQRARRHWTTSIQSIRRTWSKTVE